jgi:hypothetical protein
MLRMLHLCTSIVVLCSPLAGQRIQTMMIPAGIADDDDLSQTKVSKKEI